MVWLLHQILESLIGLLFTKSYWQIISIHRFNRRWMLVKDGRHQSQRVLPRMALIQPSFLEDGIRLQAPGMPDLDILINPLPKEVIQC